MTAISTALHEKRLHVSTGLSVARTLLRALGLLTLLTIALVCLCQALLPGIASNRLRSSLEEDGAEDVRVAIHTVPATELLLGHAGSVTVHVAQMPSSGRGGGINALLERASHASRLDATVEKLFSHGLELREVSLRKRGVALSMRASVTREAIANALPSSIHLTDVSQDLSSLRLTITAGGFGHSVSASARVLVHDGTIEIGPADPLLAFLHLTLFADPQVTVDTIRMRAQGETYLFVAEGSYV
jgi:hypothetical protein